MKRWPVQILAALVLSAAFSVPIQGSGKISDIPFSEHSWNPVALRDSSGPISHIPGFDYRLENIMFDHIQHGTPVTRLDLRNNQTQERTFTVEFAPSDSGSDVATIARQVTLPALGTASMTFPIFTYSSNYAYLLYISVRETTPKSLSYIGQISLDIRIGTRDKKPVILMADAISPEKSVYNLSDQKSSKAEYPCDILRFGRPAKDWPADHRVYSTFDAVVVPPSLYAAFPPEVRQALDDFASFGGAVLVTPDDTESGGVTNRQTRMQFMSAIEKAHKCLADKDYDAKYALESAPLDVKHSLPLNLLMAMLGIFAVVFVPISAWLCIRHNRRFHALAIIPAAATAMAIVVGIASLFFYGTIPSERLQSVTLLDQRARRAVTWGQFAVFAPSPKSRELSFPLDSTFRQQTYDDSTRHSERRLSVEIGDSYELVGDWVHPLIPTLFEFQRVSPRSEKLDVKPIGTNEIQVVNLLGAPITHGRLCFRDHIYSLDNIQPGETKVLNGRDALLRVRAPYAGGRDGPSFAKATEGMARPSQDISDILHSAPDHCRHWPQLVKHLDDPQLDLPEATYIAFVEGSPFFPSPYGKRRTHTSQEAVIVGKFAEGT